MVDNFTEVKEDSKKSEESVLSDSQFEQNLKKNLERLMLEPSVSTIDQIMEYSQSISK